MKYAILTGSPTVQQVIEAHVAFPKIDELDAFSRECAEILSTLFDELKSATLKGKPLDGRMTPTEVEKLIASTVHPLIDLCAGSEDSARGQCALGLLDTYIAECAQRLLPGQYISRKPGDMKVIGYSAGRLSRLAQSHPEQFDKAAARGLEAIGKYLSMHVDR